MKKNILNNLYNLLTILYMNIKNPEEKMLTNVLVKRHSIEIFVVPNWCIMTSFILWQDIYRSLELAGATAPLYYCTFMLESATARFKLWGI